MFRQPRDEPQYHDELGPPSIATTLTNCDTIELVKPTEFAKPVELKKPIELSKPEVALRYHQ